MRRAQRSRRLLMALPLLLALMGLCSRYIGAASADSGETSSGSDYRVAQASISASNYQQCGVTSAGGVKCWGYGGGGRLGDGTENSSSTPVDVVGLSGSVQAIATGSAATCALTATGGAQCWGNIVGDGSVNNFSTSAVDVLGMTSGVRQIDIGGGFTCFVTTSSDVQCLGENGWAQLGDGTQTGTSTVSTAIQGLAGNVRSIATMAQATCALMLDTTVKCWGYGGYGQLGDGTFGIDSNNPYVLAPTTVTGLSSVVALAGGEAHMCALTTAGAVKCWGSDSFGQLGDGTTNNSAVLVDVVGLQSGVRTITAGGFGMCALLYSNEVQCWGRNTEAFLGQGSTSGPVYTPTIVPGLSGTITAVTAGFYNACALNSIGELRCWGYLAAVATTPSPTLVSNFDGVHTRIVTSGATVLLAGYYPTLFQPWVGTNPVNLGVRVSTAEAGTVTKVLFAKDPANYGAHTAVVWDAGGNVLATQSFVNESGSGWQEVALDTPAVIAAGATFTVGYSLEHTGYAYGPAFPSLTVGPLTIDTGTYVYSANPTDYPNGSVGSNYGIDFEFMAGTPTTTTTTVLDTTTTTTVVDTTTTTVVDTTTTTTVLDTTTTVVDTTTTTTVLDTTTTTVLDTTTTVASTTTTTAAPTTTTVAPTTTTTTTTVAQLPPPPTSNPTPPTATTASAPVITTAIATTTTVAPTTTTTSVEPSTTTTTTPPAPVAPAALVTPAAQTEAVAALDSPSVTPSEVAATVTNLIDSGLTGTAATDLATSDKVLTSIDPAQAESVFAAIPVSSLSQEQVDAVSAAVTNAPTEIKNAFESTIDVYGSGFDKYVPVGSNIDVSSRRTLVAAAAAVTSIAAAAATGGSGGSAPAGGSSSGDSGGSSPAGRKPEDA